MSIASRRRAMMAVKKSRLPSAYQEVEWISSDGSAYLSTGIIPTVDSAMEAVLSASQQTSANFLGSRDGSTGTDKAFLVASYNSANKFGFMRWGYGVQTIAFDTNWHKFYLSPTEAKVDDVAYSMSAPKSQTSTRTIFLFRDNGNISLLHISIRYFRFWENGSLIADYVPCYRKSDNEIGMYDMATDTFKTNNGTGTFTKGADVT